MLSAFGVDHGEFSKARFVRPPRRPPRRPTPPGEPRAKTGPQKIASAFNRAGEADISLKGIGRGTGKSLKGIGGFLEKRPGLTGTALVGGGGAAGYHVLSEKQPKRKRTS